MKTRRKIIRNGMAYLIKKKVMIPTCIFGKVFLSVFINGMRDVAIKDIHNIKIINVIISIDISIDHISILFFLISNMIFNAFSIEANTW